MKKINYLSFIYIIFGFAIVILLVLNLNKNNNSSNSAKSTNSPSVQGEGNIPANSNTKIGNSPYLGDKSKAKVAIVEYSDYECPYCKKFNDETKGQIIAKYVNTGKVIFVFRNMPLPFHGDAAIKDAQAALCANEIGGSQKYFQMQDKIFANSGLNGQGIASDKMISLATDLGLDKDKFTACINDTNKFKDQIEDDTKAGNDAGISGTPGFVIGILGDDGSVKGELLAGAYPFADFESAISRQMANIK